MKISLLVEYHSHFEGSIKSNTWTLLMAQQWHQILLEQEPSLSYVHKIFLGCRYLQESFLNMDKMLNLLAEEPEVKDLPSATTLAVKNGGIEFRNVAFSYVPERPILKNISFKVEPGKTIAIVRANFMILLITERVHSKIFSLDFPLFHNYAHKTLFLEKLLAKILFRSAIYTNKHEIIIFTKN